MTIYDNGTKIVRKLQEAGHIAYFAGGWVRDFIMEHPSDDIDIATNASVDEIRSLFPKIIPVGIAFGIVIVPMGNHHFEVASFRTDVGYADGRRPLAIKPATPQEDAQRRDFTINGMFYDPIKKEVWDFVEGKKDIANRLVRAIGDPHERFKEDRLRMMRAVRYASRFSFTIDPATLKAIKQHARELLPSVAMERIWQEFEKMSRFSHFDRGLILLYELDLLPVIFPALASCSLQEIKDRVRYVEHFPKNTPCIAELLELFPAISKEDFRVLCDYLKLSNVDRSFGEFLVHTKTLFSMPQEWTDKLEKIEWAQFYANPFSQLCIEICALSLPSPKEFISSHHQRITHLQNAINRIREKKPVLTSAHLIEAGIEPGVKMGQLLKEGERLAVNQGFEDPKAIIAQLRTSKLW